jgi:hypothetical protein
VWMCAVHADHYYHQYCHSVLHSVPLSSLQLITLLRSISTPHQGASFSSNTIDSETVPHLTYYAQGFVKTQSELVANYKFDMVQPANPAMFTVHDRRPAQDEVVCTVKISESTMECSCGMPTSYLLPCRHVLVVNNHVFNTQFRASQVGKRWLQAYMRRGREESVVYVDEPEMDISVPSLSESVTASSTNMPSRQALWGQLNGWCSTLCAIGCQPNMFRYVSAQLQSLCKDVEAKVAASMRARAAPLALRFAVPTVAPELHPDVHISDMQMTNHRKRARGRGQDKRQKSAYERASALSASQSM